MSARFYNQETKSKLKEKRRLSSYLDDLVKAYRSNEGKISLTYIFCTDEYLLEMNQQFLNHNTYTDIITFDLTEPDQTLSGEIYISTDRVEENALKFGTTYNEELHRVIFHGVLHLCGFKDKSATDKKKMRAMEDQCLKEYLG